MLGRLDRLLAVLSSPRVSLGIVPTTSSYRVPTNQLIMFDDRVVHVEAILAELAITRPREIALYIKAFRVLSELAVYGAEAGRLVRAALQKRP